MSQRMRFVYNDNSGTYNFDDNPVKYQPIKRTLEDTKRSTDGHLQSNFHGDYNYFLLIFDSIGTNQFTQFQTIHATHKNIVFYPFDELRGTSLSYTVKWLGDFDFPFTENWWEGGCSGAILLETV